MGTDIIVVLGAFIGTCAYFSYKNGMKDGYQKMAFEVATAIVDIAIEKEKIEVMKGASSTLYGTGAATGVINITLKKSSQKKIQNN